MKNLDYFELYTDYESYAKVNNYNRNFELFYKFIQKYKYTYENYINFHKNDIHNLYECMIENYKQFIIYVVNCKTVFINKSDSVEKQNEYRKMLIENSIKDLK